MKYSEAFVANNNSAAVRMETLFMDVFTYIDSRLGSTSMFFLIHIKRFTKTINFVLTTRRFIYLVIFY